MALQIDETFEAPGFMETGWSTNGGAVPNAAVSGAGSPAGWGNYCLRCSAIGDSVSDGDNELGTYTDSWLHFEFVVTAELLSTWQSVSLFESFNSSWSYLYGIWLIKDADGLLHPRILANHDGTGAVAYDSPTSFALNTKHSIDVKWDNTNKMWAWRFDGVDQDNNVDNGNPPVTSEGTMAVSRNNISIYIFGTSGGDAACTVYFDNFKLDNAGWVSTSQAISRNFSDGISAVDLIGKGAGKRLAETVAPSDLVRKGPGKRLTDTVASSDSVRRGLSRALSDLAQSIETLKKGPGKSVSDSISTSDSGKRGAGKALKDTATTSESLRRAQTRTLTDTSALSDSTRKGPARRLNDTMTASDSTRKGTGKNLVDVIAPADMFGRLLSKFLILVDQVGLSDTVLNGLRWMKDHFNPKAWSKSTRSTSAWGKASRKNSTWTK